MNEDTVFEIDIEKPRVPRFKLKFKDPGHDKADESGFVVLAYDTVEISQSLMQSDLMEYAIAENDMTQVLVDKKGKKTKRKLKKGEWMFDLSGERLIRFKCDNKNMTLKENMKAVADYVALGRELFGLDDMLVTRDQVLEIWTGFKFHCNKHMDAITEIFKGHERKLNQKKNS